MGKVTILIAKIHFFGENKCKFVEKLNVRDWGNISNPITSYDNGSYEDFKFKQESRALK